MGERFDTFSPPPPEPDPFELAARSATTAEADMEGLDPREAAALLERASRQAQNELMRRSPLLMLIGAATVIVVYGALWLSVRHQHPYVGPRGWALGVLYGVLTVWIAVAAIFQHRAAKGIGGRSTRQRRLVGLAFAAAWISVYVLQGALHHAGASDAIAYGLYPAAAPLIVVGSAAATYSAAREDLSATAASMAAVAVATGAAFAGAATSWLVSGIGLAVVVLAYAAALVRERRA